MGSTRLSCKLAHKMGAGQQGDNRRPAFTSEARKEDGKMMRALRLMAIAVPALFVAGLAISQGIEWETLTQEVMDLHRAERYDRAVVVAKRALEVAERSVGPDHPDYVDVAMSLNNLAFLYFNQGQHAQAEPLLKRALAIYEKALGPDHPDVAMSLENIAHLYRTTKRNEEAELLEARAARIRAIER